MPSLPGRARSLKALVIGWLLLLFACSDRPGPELCGDSLDNDGDGAIDCLDAECLHAGGCDFATCLDGNDCQGALCLTEPNNGFPSGACSSFCQLDAPLCPFGPDSVCIDIDLGDGRGICVDPCQASAECRENLNCRDSLVGLPICLPDCASDLDCPITGRCNRDNGFCESTPEVCDNVTDDDGDGRSDCADLDCANASACDPAVVCETSQPISFEITTDTTEEGTNLFSGSCVSGLADLAGRERLFSFTPLTPAALRVTLASPTVHGVYALADCALNLELACVNNFERDPAELIIPANRITVGSPITLVVDGFLTGQEGPFSLSIAEVAPESDCADLFDEDFDNNTDCQDDDCAAVCTPGAGALGAPCLGPSDCQAINGLPACFNEISQGFPSGYCTGFCTVDSQCGEGICQQGLCFQTCLQASDCQTPGYQCLPSGDDLLCAPGCTDNTQCPLAGFCDSDLGVCKQVEEDCDNFIDDDGDGLEDCQDEVCRLHEPSCDESLNCADGLDNDLDLLIDCEDLDCAPDSVCQLDALCAAAAVLTGDTAGDTTSGSQQFAGSCTGANLSHEVLFTFTPGLAGQTGILSLALDSVTDQGMYIRTVCQDPATELDCEDSRDGGLTESTAIPNVPGGAPLTIFVDGFQDPNNSGPFTLTVLYTPL